MCKKSLRGLNATASTFIVICLLFIAGCSKDQSNTSQKSPNDGIGLDGNSLKKIYNPGAGDSSVFIVDQADTILVHPFIYNSFFFAPIGQEFVPNLFALDAVEITLDDASCAGNGSNGGDVQIRIRQSTIDGQIIGVSDTVHFVNCFAGVKRFPFRTFIPVTPGQKYVIDIVYAGGHSSGVTLDDGPSLYTRGSLIFEGKVNANRDLWFREGLDKSVARTKDQAFKEGWKNLVRKDGTRFKNQGDCLQYINNNR